MQENQVADAAPAEVEEPAQKVADELCEREIVRMCKARRIDSDTTRMPLAMRRRFEVLKRALLAPMRRGELTVGSDGNPTYTPPVEGAKPIKFHRATGATLMAGDGFEPYKDVARLIALATALTKSVPGALSELDVADMSVVSSLTNFFTYSRALDLVVVRGGDGEFETDLKTQDSYHTFQIVYTHMLRQVCRDYGGSLLDAKRLTLDEIVFFYNGLRSELRARTKP
jgi:hypothetical protein